MDNLYQQLKSFGRVKLNEPMYKHTTFRIGGPARYYVEVGDKIVQLLDFLTGEGIDYFILGGGSNLLFSDNEYDGVVIRMQNADLPAMPFARRWQAGCRMQNDNTIVADSGVLLGQVVNLAAQNSLAGMEWGIGIPGTIGGATRGNAGAFGSDISKVLSKVEIWRDGEIIELSNSDCQFAYRESGFKTYGGVVLRAYIALERGEEKAIVSLMQKYMQLRMGRIPPYSSPGCFFKNLKLSDWSGDKTVLAPKFIESGKIPAGWLVEQAGCKGLKCGDAVLSDIHSNIIVNLGNAAQADVLRLVEEIREKVYNKFKVELEPEVEIVRS